MLKKIEQIFRLDDETWLRHSNPWSVWTRILGLFLLILSVWSRDWIGYYSLIPIAFAIWWIWINPRFFSPPKDYQNWATKCVLGEKFYMSIPAVKLPSHHKLLPKILNGTNAIGAIIIAISLYRLDPMQLILGTVIQLGSKLWYLDRMVWLYSDLNETKN